MFCSRIVAVYRGIPISRYEGLYSCLLDYSIETEFFMNIMKYIDTYFKIMPTIPLVDEYIIGEYVVRCNLSNIKN